MFTILSVVATSANSNHNNSNSLWVILMVVAVIVIAAVILCFKNIKSKQGQIEDEKFYLREIRNYVRIIAIIIIAWVIISIISWILALM